MGAIRHSTEIVLYILFSSLNAVVEVIINNTAVELYILVLLLNAIVGVIRHNR